MGEPIPPAILEGQKRLEQKRLENGIPINGRRPKPEAQPEAEKKEPRRADFGSVLRALPTLSPEEEQKENERRAARKLSDQQKKEHAEREVRRKRIADHKLPITTANELLLLDDCLSETNSLGFVRQWLDGDRPWLTLCGTVGRGKTMAAAWALAKSYGAYMQARELERIFAARYGDELEAQERVLSCGLLVIDDIGRERDAQGMTIALLEVIDHRRRAHRRTIAITNLSKSAFLERYPDPRLHSRLCESGAWGVDSGPDMRK